MSNFDGILNQVTSALGGTPGQQSGLAGSVLNMINNQPGGLGGLVQRFEQNGLGHIMSSWVSTGANHPISAQQIQQVLGNEELRKFATEHGIDVDQAAGQLAQLLPTLVDKLTPNGQLPQAGGIMHSLEGLLGGPQQ